MRILISIFLHSLFFLCYASAQTNYTSYLTGSAVDLVSNAQGGVCLMGGATENDEAMKWFLQRASGGDVLVLRASGSNGYNNYLYSSLGITLNSVETIVFHNATAAGETYIHQRINSAEAIWIAGGDQWDYISYWRHTPVDSLINKAIQERNVIIGGTSAGMAILGKYYFTAQNSTVTSSVALNNPYNVNITVDSARFIQNNFLTDVITDTHYDNPDRKGRHVTFLARIMSDYGTVGKGIACDEYTAVCIDENGMARVFGTYPQYDDNAYFIQPNCELPNMLPENCVSGQPLNWNYSAQALKVYAVKGTSTGSHSFNLADWHTGSGGIWENWYVDNGALFEIAGAPINCNPVFVDDDAQENDINIFYDTKDGSLNIYVSNGINKSTLSIYNVLGQVVHKEELNNGQNKLNLNLVTGTYLVSVLSGGMVKTEKVFLK